jgi:hypothetical protein
MLANAAAGSEKNIVPEPADRHVEAARSEGVHLRVAQLEADVGELFGRSGFTGALQHAFGDIDAQNAAGRRRARRFASRQPGSATDVEDPVTGADAVGGAEVPVVSAQHRVVEVRNGRRTHGRDATAAIAPLEQPPAWRRGG